MTQDFDRSAERSGSPEWRLRQRDRLLAVAADSRLPIGFGWLDDQGRVAPDKRLELWINARMTYVFARASMEITRPAGTAIEPRTYAELAKHGVSALTTAFHDDDDGGWYHEVGLDGDAADDTKACYDHAFVILASAAATRAGIPDAAELLSEALQTHHDRFWDPDAAWVLDTRSRDWSQIEPYRGGNAAMHTVEAWLAAAAATQDTRWLDLATSLSRGVVAAAEGNDWRLIEHFHPDLTPDLDYNRDRPRDPFRPYGATPGHAFEWARLLLELDDARVAAGLEPTGFLAPAESLFARAVDDVVTEEPGLPYTTDWAGSPVVEERFHWVIAEAAMSSESLEEHTHEGRYAGLAARWWEEIRRWFIAEDGSWRHELSPTMGFSDTTWSGRPDAYHAYNALSHRRDEFEHGVRS